MSLSEIKRFSCLKVLCTQPELRMQSAVPPPKHDTILGAVSPLQSEVDNIPRHRTVSIVVQGTERNADSNR